VVHEGQRLAVGLEAGDDLAGVHAGLDQFQRNGAAEWLLLPGKVDNSHAAFAQHPDGGIRTEPLTIFFGTFRHGGLRFARQHLS
jgi:hypothetical protein